MILRSHPKPSFLTQLFQCTFSTFLFVSLVIVFPCNSLAQAPSFPVDGGRWVEETTVWDSEFAPQFKRVSYEQIGDTVINNITYSKLYQKFTCHLEEVLLHDGTVQSFTSIDSTLLFRGGLRTDGQGKVYLYHYELEVEGLLYDFNVQVGDSVVVWRPLNGYYPMEMDTLVVTSVSAGNAAIGNKVIDLGWPNAGQLYFDYYQWVEGVGSSKGLFAQNRSYLLEYTTELLCFSVNGSSPFSDYEECLDLEDCLHDHTASNPFNHLIVYPNPGSSTFHLLMPEDEVITATHWELVNVSGYTVKSGLFSSDMVISVEDLAEGLYFLRYGTQTESSEAIKERVVRVVVAH